MMDNLKIDKERGCVTIPLMENFAVSYEAIESIYIKILPLLKKRRKAGLREGASTE